MVPTPETILNYIAGEWRQSTAREQLDVINPATGKIIAKVPLSSQEEVGHAVAAAAKTLRDWMNVPAPERIQYLFMEVHLKY